MDDEQKREVANAMAERLSDFVNADAPRDARFWRISFHRVQKSSFDVYYPNGQPAVCDEPYYVKTSIEYSNYEEGLGDDWIPLR